MESNQKYISRFNFNVEEMEGLRIIIERNLEIDLLSKQRKRDNVDGRRIFSKVLYDRNYSLTSIGNFLNKDHSTIIHYIDDIDSLFKQDHSLFSNYITCRDEFYDNESTMELVIKSEKTSFTVKDMKKNLEKLMLERQDVLTLKNKYSRLESIIEIIDQRLRKGDEYLLAKKLNTIFNSKKI